jgi:hypothetical protein
MTLERIHNRYWNCVGLKNPFDGIPAPTVEINPPLRGMRGRIGFRVAGRMQRLGRVLGLPVDLQGYPRMPGAPHEDLQLYSRTDDGRNGISTRPST